MVATAPRLEGGAGAPRRGDRAGAVRPPGASRRIILGLAFSPDGDRLASAGVRQGAEHKGELTLWDVRDRPRAGHPARARPGRPRRGLQPDGRYVAAGYGREHGRSMRAGPRQGLGGVDRQAETDRHPHGPDHPGPVYSVAFSPDAADRRGRRRAGADLGRRRRGLVARPRPPGHTGVVFAVAFRPDGKQLATAGWDRDHPALGPGHRPRGAGPLRPRRVRPLPGLQPRRPSPGPAARTGRVLLWDTETGRPEATFRGHRDFVMALAFHPDGRRLASGGTDRLVKTWDLAAGQPLVFRGHGGWVLSLDFSPDGRRVVSGGGPSARNGACGSGMRPPAGELLSYRGHQQEPAVLLARFRPDGRHVVSVECDATVRVWDATDGHDVAPPLDHPPCPQWLFGCGWAIRPDGRELAVGATDGTVRLWDLADGQGAPRTLPGHTGKVVGAGLRPRRPPPGLDQRPRGTSRTDDARPGGRAEALGRGDRPRAGHPAAGHRRLPVAGVQPRWPSPRPVRRGLL